MTNSPVHVIGATGRTGAVLCRLLHAHGTEIIPIIRSPEKWTALNLPGTPRLANLNNPATLQSALSDATRIVSVSYAAWTHAILAAAPPQARLVLTGTARRYTESDDPAATDAKTAERQLLASARDAVILHPTMLYGAPNDGTVTRLAALIRRYPILPLPAAGRPLVQPLHVADLAEALRRALNRPWPTPTALPVAGPTPLPTAAFIRAIATAIHHRPPLILPLPTPLLHLAVYRRPSLRRLLDDRNVDVAPMAIELGLVGRGLQRGLAEAFPAVIASNEAGGHHTHP